MSSRTQCIGAIWAGLVLAAATMLLCRSPSMDQSPESHPPISHVAALLTTPLESTSPADVRIVVLPIGLAGLLVVVAIGWPSSGAGRPAPSRENIVSATTRVLGRNGIGEAGSARAIKGFAVAGCALVLIALLSAWANHSWDLSRGWVLLTAIGLAWSLTLGSVFDRRSARLGLNAALIVAAIATLLTLWHRQVLGFRDPRWPIGPITLCSGLGAIWCAMSAGLAAVRLTSPPTDTRADLTGTALETSASMVFPFMGGALGLSLLYLSSRRAGWVGLAVALGIIALTLLRDRLSVRAFRFVWITGLLVAASCAGLWGYAQVRSVQREVSGSIELRGIYWRTALEEISRHPLLGYGPDMSVCRITTALARRHAESPHLLHGDIIPAIHNEWLQAAAELGIPGGLIFFALPIAVIWLTLRRKSTGGAPSAAGLAAAAGLVAILASESFSINLRNPILPVWYWTLLGLALGSRRPGTPSDSAREPASRSAQKLSPTVARVGLIGAAVAILFLGYDQIECDRAHAAGIRLRSTDPQTAASLLELAEGRFGAEQDLSRQFDEGRAASDAVRAIRKATAATAAAGSSPARSTERDWAARSVEIWESLNRNCPGYPRAGGFFADALLLNGRASDALLLLSQYLNQINPYDPSANMLYLALAKASPAESIERLARAARGGAIDEAMIRRLNDALADVNASRIWRQQIEQAEAELATTSGPDGKDALAPERLRLAAARLAAGHADAPLSSESALPVAVRLQTSAAEAYRRWEQSNDPRRRASDAEWNCWYRAAEYTFRADPGAVNAAFAMIQEAERYAILGLDHAYLRDPPPKGEFVGEVVIPLELPDSLRPLWRLSAKLHMAAGARPGQTELRLRSCLPPDAQSADNLRALFAAMARELTDDWTTLPAERRPANFDRIRQLAVEFSGGGGS